MSIAFGRWEERAPVGGACAGGGRARAGGRNVPAGGARAGGETCAGGEKKRVAFSRRPVAQWD